MSPRKYEVDPTKGVFEVEWPLFGELSRALALKVAREYDPEIVVGIATAGVIPGAVVAGLQSSHPRTKRRARDRRAVCFSATGA